MEYRFAIDSAFGSHSHHHKTRIHGGYLDRSPGHPISDQPDFVIQVDAQIFLGSIYYYELNIEDRVLTLLRTAKGRDLYPAKWLLHPLARLHDGRISGGRGYA